MTRAGRIVFLAALLTLLLTGPVGARGGGEREASKDPFWLGHYFAGMQVTHDDRFRGASISYGDCELPEGEGGCQLPAQIQTSTSCARNPIGLDSRPSRVYRLRGGGLAAQYETGWVDVGTGNLTATVFTSEIVLASAALRELRRHSQPTPQPLPPPVYPIVVLRELKRVTAVAERVHGVPAIAKATGLSPFDVRLRLRIADLLGPKALAGVPVPTMSVATLERLRQLAFSVDELGLAKTAAANHLTPAQVKAQIRRVRGLTGDC